MSVLQKYKKLQKKLERERMFKQQTQSRYEFGVWLRMKTRKEIYLKVGSAGAIEDKVAEVKILTSKLPDMLLQIKKSKQRIRAIQNEMSGLLK